MHRAALDVQKGMKECKKKYGEYYILKMDVAKYFPSIDRDILMNIIKRKIKDKDVIWLLEEIVYKKEDIKGLPIGNLTSQILANVYYNEADQYIKHILKIKYYYRYMDDSIILLQNKEELKQVKQKIEFNFLYNSKLHISLATFKIGLVNKIFSNSNEQIVNIKAYDEQADKVYKNLKKDDFVMIEGYFDGKAVNICHFIMIM